MSGTVVTVANGESRIIGSAFSPTTLPDGSTITLNSSGSQTTLKVTSLVTLNAGSTITLSASAFNLLTGTGTTQDKLVLTDSSIVGAGIIDLDLQTSATSKVIATFRATPLSYRDSIITNGGTLWASGPGRLELLRDTIDNGSTGQLLASGTGAVLLLTGSTLKGGTYITTGGGAIRVTSTSLAGESIVGSGFTLLDGSANAVVVQAGSSVDVGNGATLRLTGVLQLDGTLKVSSVGEATTLRIDGLTALDGAAGIVLSGGTITGNGGSLTNRSAIAGDGTIGDLSVINGPAGQIVGNTSAGLTLAGTNVTNAGLLLATAAVRSADGTITVPGGLLTLNGGRIFGGGTIRAAEDGTVVLSGARIIGGTLDAIGQMTAQGAATSLDGVRIQGTLAVASGAELGVQGTIDNRGLIRVGDPSGLGATLVIAGATSLTGGGTVQLAGAGTSIQFTVDRPLLTNVDNLIRGEGQISVADMTNGPRGILQADVAGKTLAFGDTSAFLSTSSLTNQGLLKATNGGSLFVAATALTNLTFIGTTGTLTGGSYAADAGSVLRFING